MRLLNGEISATGVIIATYQLTGEPTLQDVE
jgi:hypothetical protein